MSEDLTPPEFACAVTMGCPSVHRLVIDGKRHLLIVGRLVNSEEVSQELWESFGPDEALIAIEEDLLSGIGCQAEVTAKGEGSAPSAFQPTDSAEADPRCNVCGQQLHMGCCNPGRSVNYAALTGSARSGPIEEARHGR